MKGVKKAKIVREAKKSQQPRSVPKTLEEMKAENERARVRARKAAAERERKRNRAATWDYLKKTPFFFKVIAIIVTIVIVTVSIIGISALISGLSTQTSTSTSMVEPEETTLEVKSSKVATTETPAVPETGKVETEIKTTPIYIYLNQGSTNTSPAKPATPAPVKPTTPTFDHEHYATDDNYEEPIFPIAPTEPDPDPEPEEPTPEESEETLDSVQNPDSVL